MVKLKSKINLVYFIEELEKTRRYQEGRVTFDASFMGLRLVEQILYSYLEYNPQIPELVMKGIISSAIFNIAKHKITLSGLLQEITKHENKYLSLPIQKFYLITTLSIDRYSKIPLIRMNDVTFTFKSTLSHQFQNSRNKLQDRVQRLYVTKIPENYLYVQGSTHSRTPEEAFEKIFTELSYLRFFWNFYYLRKKGFTFHFGGSDILKPLNLIIPGPFHTVHDEKGKIEEDIFYYNEKFLWPISATSILNDYDELWKFHRKYVKKFSKHLYRDEIKKGLLMYVNALDEYQIGNAFIKLWSVIEYWTGSWNKDDSIQRLCFLFKDASYNKQILTHLKEYRNRIIHGDYYNQDEKDFLFQLLYYVNSILSFHIWNKYGFKTIEDTYEFLSIPSDEVEILMKIDLYKKASNFRGVI